jgi:hypothetical protein
VVQRTGIPVGVECNGLFVAALVVAGQVEAEAAQSLEAQTAAIAALAGFRRCCIGGWKTMFELAVVMLVLYQKHQAQNSFVLEAVMPDRDYVPSYQGCRQLVRTAGCSVVD